MQFFKKLSNSSKILVENIIATQTPNLDCPEFKEALSKYCYCFENNPLYRQLLEKKGILHAAIPFRGQNIVVALNPEQQPEVQNEFN